MNRLLSNLGLCRRAGKLTFGFDAVTTALAQGKVRMLLVTADLSRKTEKELLYQAKETDVPVYRLPYTMEELCCLLAKRVGILAVTDDQLANLIYNSLSTDVESLKEAGSL